MPDHSDITVSGVIADIFAHRFVLETPEGRVLADLTPRGAERIALIPGSRVTISGERNVSEIKVRRFTPDGGQEVAIDEGRGDKKRHEDETGGDLEAARRTAESEGFTVVAGPRRKPKHWEVLVRDAEDHLRELHVELDGGLRKVKDADPAKWPQHIAGPAGTDGVEERVLER